MLQCGDDPNAHKEKENRTKLKMREQKLGRRQARTQGAQNWQKSRQEDPKAQRNSLDHKEGGQRRDNLQTEEQMRRRVKQ